MRLIRGHPCVSCGATGRLEDERRLLCKRCYRRQAHRGLLAPITIELLLNNWREVTENDCWLWLGASDDRGYGRWNHRYAHRLSYELYVGPIPHGLEVDHLCRVKGCFNPAHLEAVSAQENVLRSFRATHRAFIENCCPRGHEYTPENTYRKPSRPNKRECRACNNERSRRNRARARANRVAA